MPPIFTINRGIKVIEGKSVYLSRADLDVKDADTSFNKIFFTILKQAKYGRLENMKEPGKLYLFHTIRNNSSLIDFNFNLKVNESTHSHTKIFL